MSGVLRKIGKVFKKIVKSKIFKVILIAAAVYFTAGVALAAGGSAFAASLPGITAAGQAVGLSGVGAIAATGAEVGAAAMAGTGIVEGAGVLGGAAEGGGGAIAGMSGVGGANVGAVTPMAGLGMEAPLSAMAEEVGAGAVGSTSAVAGEAAGGAGSTFGTSASTATGFGGTGVDKAVSAAKDAAGSGGDGLWKSFSTWAEKNPVVAKAAMTFVGEGAKTGFQAFAAKSAQDAAEERYQQDRVDRTRMQAVPALRNPAPGGGYNAGVVNSAAGIEKDRP